MSSPRLWASDRVASGNPHGPLGCSAFINKFISDLRCHNWEDNFLFFKGSPHTHENSSRELEQTRRAPTPGDVTAIKPLDRSATLRPAPLHAGGQALLGPGRNPQLTQLMCTRGHCIRNHPVSCPIQQDHRPRVTSVLGIDAATKTPASVPEW